MGAGMLPYYLYFKAQEMGDEYRWLVFLFFPFFNLAFRFIGRLVGRTVDIPDIMLSDRYNIAIQIYCFRVVFFFLEFSSSDNLDFLIVIFLKCFLKFCAFVAEAIALRGLMQLQDPPPRNVRYQLDFFKPQSVFRVTQRFISRFGFFQIGDISSILCFDIVMVVFWMISDNYMQELSDERLNYIILFSGYEIIIEIFICLLVPLIIKPCREEFRNKNFLDIAL